MCQRINNKNGSVLTLTVLFVLVFLLLGLAVIRHAGNQNAFAQRMQFSSESFWLADGGVEIAFAKLPDNTIHDPYDEDKPLMIDATDPSHSYDRQFNIYSEELPGGKKWRIFSQGCVNGTISDDCTSGQNRNIEAKVLAVNFGNNFFADKGFRLHGSPGEGPMKSDSYDSDSGTYPAADNADDRREGDIATNGDIEINGGSVYIDGDATPGPGQEVDHPDQVSGSTESAEGPIVIPPVSSANMSAASTSNNNTYVGVSPYIIGGNFDIKANQTAHFEAGTYYFTGFSVTGNATVTTDGDVTIYIDGGDMFVGGNGITNQTQTPGNLNIISTGSSVTFTGGSATYAVVYAPDAEVALDGCDFYGAITCSVIDVGGNTSLHYDMALRDVGPPDIQMVSWKECPFEGC